MAHWESSLVAVGSRAPDTVYFFAKVIERERERDSTNANWLYFMRKLFAVEQTKNKEQNWNEKYDDDDRGTNCRALKGTSEWMGERMTERDSAYDIF